MRIVFENEAEKARLATMIDHAIEQVEMDIRDRILLASIKNVLLFFHIEMEKGAVQLERNVTPQAAALAAPTKKDEVK